MGNPVLSPVRVWCKTISDMLVIGTSARLIWIRAAVINMRMAAHTLTNKVAHHRSTVIVGGKASTIQFYSSPVGSFYGPFGFRHGAMTCFVLLLGVSWCCYQPVESLTKGDTDHEARCRSIHTCHTYHYGVVRLKVAMSDRPCN